MISGVIHNSRWSPSYARHDECPYAPSHLSVDIVTVHLVTLNVDWRCKALLLTCFSRRQMKIFVDILKTHCNDCRNCENKTLEIKFSQQLKIFGKNSSSLQTRCDAHKPQASMWWKRGGKYDQPSMPTYMLANTHQQTNGKKHPPE